MSDLQVDCLSVSTSKWTAMADTFRITTDPQRGRCAIATTALHPGDLILAAPTLAFAVNDALVCERCAVSGCATTNITCEACEDEEHYCDGVEATGETRLARLVAAARASDREGLAELVSHLDDFDEETLNFAAYSAALARRWWPMSAKCSQERALEDVLRCHCNAFAVLLPTPALSQRERAAARARHGLALEIGLAVAPAAAVFNHSCAANAFARVRLRPGRHPCVEVRAIRPIAGDEEICISYCDGVGDATARRKVLRDSFFFDCACERCVAEEAAPTPSFVIEGDAAAKATALEASADPTARLVYAPLARCLESEAAGAPLTPHVGGLVVAHLSAAFGPAFSGEWGDRAIYPQ